MASGWMRDKAWSDRYSPHIQAILGSVFFKPASLVEDQRRNTDFDLEFSAGDIRVAARLRKPRDARYMPEFTIRSARPSGTKTELDKVREGWGDFLFYGFVHLDEVHIGHWVIVNLTGFRGQEPYLRFTSKPNRDWSSEFRAYSTFDLWPHSIEAAYEWPLTPEQADVAKRPVVVPVTRIEDRRTA